MELNNLSTWCENNFPKCLLYTWWIFVTIIIIVYYFLNNNALSNDKYIIELNKLNIADEYQAHEKYRIIQKNMNEYITSKLTENCNKHLLKYQRQDCFKKQAFEKKEYRTEYINTKLSIEEQKFLKLYEAQQRYIRLMIYMFSGYVGVPLIITILMYGAYYAPFVFQNYI